MPTERLTGRALYHLHSLGAAGAPSRNPDVDAPVPSGRGLRVLGGWLDHVAGLGCGGVLLTPVFVSTTHGYDTVDPSASTSGWATTTTSTPSSTPAVPARSS